MDQGQLFREENFLSEVSVVYRDSYWVDFPNGKKDKMEKYTASFWYDISGNPTLIEIEFTRSKFDREYLNIRIFSVKETGKLFWKRESRTELFIGMDATKKKILWKAIEIYQKEQKEMLGCSESAI